MSRIGKQIINIPAGTEVKQTGTSMSIKGPKGTLVRDFPGTVAININGAEITLTPKNENDKTERSLWGTYASHIKNMVAGVNTGYTKKLILEGVGFKSEVAGKVLKLALGFSHPVNVDIPEGLTVTAEKNIVTVTGIDKELVGQWTAGVRSLKKPEPYKGKGFRYDTEVIRRKQGKKAA
ncbi:MAG: 50S ribosomal protein L6 [Candidatus Nomurabacteria bacterium]|nr:50S ribosomal protein L6 [Candidatus Nomurabacteria bacterium]